MKLYYGDCLQSLKELKNESVDLVLCDLPYGITAPQWDKVIDMGLLWSEYNRIVKKDGNIVLFASQPFTTKLIESNSKNFRYTWYWLKNQSTNFFHAKSMPLRKVEEICVFKVKGGKSMRYYPQITDGHEPTNSSKGSTNGSAYHGDKKRDYEGGSTTRFPNNVLEFKCVDNYSRIHSSEKPVELLEYLIKTYTIENDVVLDNTMGSGSTGEACRNLNRYFIGMENDEKYFNKAKERLS